MDTISQPTPPAPQPTRSSLPDMPNGHQPHHASPLLKVLLLVFALLLVGALGYMVRDFQLTSYDSNDTIKVAKNGEAAAATEESEEKTTSATADWKTYTNADLGFTIQYPTRLSGDTADWEYNDALSLSGDNLKDIIGFRPASLVNDYVWMVNVYGKASTVSELSDETGKQFADREEKEETITVNGKTAKLYTVTTPSTPDWISKTVYIETDSHIYAIGNGAIDNSSFDEFYGSFKLTN